MALTKVTSKQVTYKKPNATIVNLQEQLDDIVGSGVGTGVKVNQAIGQDALSSATTGDYNIAIGYEALKLNDVGEQNTALGYKALANAQNYDNPFYPVPDSDPANEYLETSGNVAIGFEAGKAIKGGNYNVAIGHGAIGVLTDPIDGAWGPAQGSGNIAIGAAALAKNFTGEQNVAIGLGAGNEASVFNLTNESGRVVLGESGISNFYCKVALTVTSDARDKTDFQTVPYGLAFVNELAPIVYRWDDRYRYFDKVEDAEGNITTIERAKDGSRAGEEYHLGFRAQDVIALEKKYGATKCMIADEEQADKLKITETKMIPVLVKALQELSAKFDAYVEAHP